MYLLFQGAKLISEGQLQISNVSRHNSTNYACVVANVAGSAYSSVDLDVEWPPRFVANATTDVEVVKGNDWFFDCSVDAKPRAKVSTQTPSHIWSDHNSTNYACVVANEAGSAYSTVDCDVERPL